MAQSALNLDDIAPIRWPTPAFEHYQGVGMTSQRTRDRLVVQLYTAGIRDARVLQAMRVTPRHLFVEEALQSRAYENTALPIGYGQTISQPWMVAYMTQFLLEKGTPQRVLEVGTGSGYQTAILAQLVAELHTVERIQPLLERALHTLSRLGLSGINAHLSDGQWGWPKAGPYDAILSAASPARVPEALLDQLAVGGRLVMPVGEDAQRLIGIEKTPAGLVEHDLGPARFVPMRNGVEAMGQAT
ncbi:protein-L-isoaspartate(D-aspartate) O-methyltransferase [Sulfurivirga caldicuralii]|uniref:Protein-L-isoaspartate O-methyltransferase n=2 Tax=Sulfurivirga caldicuralii TaxID=364032 RepID=A0A1N6F8Z6_9GAMM|nr:protein-L-isoaspartate(D-aspartate) O-methyltransferase [Sulfurivirga caldicuralii]